MELFHYFEISILYCINLNTEIQYTIFILIDIYYYYCSLSQIYCTESKFIRFIFITPSNEYALIQSDPKLLQQKKKGDSAQQVEKYFP